MQLTSVNIKFLSCLDGFLFTSNVTSSFVAVSLMSFPFSILHILAVPSSDPMNRLPPLGENSQKWTALENILKESTKDTIDWGFGFLVVCDLTKALRSILQSKISPRSVPAATVPFLLMCTVLIFLLRAPALKSLGWSMRQNRSRRGSYYWPELPFGGLPLLLLLPWLGESKLANCSKYAISS